jgi:hypothetical protein
VSGRLVILGQHVGAELPAPGDRLVISITIVVVVVIIITIVVVATLAAKTTDA